MDDKDILPYEGAFSREDFMTAQSVTEKVILYSVHSIISLILLSLVWLAYHRTGWVAASLVALFEVLLIYAVVLFACERAKTRGSFDRIIRDEFTYFLKEEIRK
ncbi:hypothetical protein [Candidatus Odyssella thessalonicensis]|uniref:hypothetical protein n=1 Tax=Candidatus Odyssella thessalonicensis TaxID=84647 RepID=UPI000225B209|nr:hypothetical protein [Candidatus Odyssella thessalonicensis]